MLKKIIVTLLIGSFFLLPTKAFAHEAYVLTRQEFARGLSINTPNPLSGLLDPAFLNITILITICVIAGYFLAILFATTPLASYLDKVIKKANVIGPLIIRVAISASFFYAGLANSVLGPELNLANIPEGMVVRFLLFLISFMVLSGIFTEVAAFLGLVVFIYIAKFYGLYMITYANYLGELIVLFLFGSRFFSFDKYFFGKKTWFKKIEKFRDLEVPVVRVMYGIALMYAGWNVKFMHQNLSIMVYNQYHLKDFFHASASFIASGAGLTEILIGFFIATGFVMRFTVIISLTFITLSILYFREMLWPHFMLYGISFSLIINSGDKFTLDRYLVGWVRKIIYKLFQYLHLE